MIFEAIIAPTITELFEERLQGMILSGELPIGEKLPTEQELADSMRISKSTVHAGIKSMEHKGFLRVVPRHGVYVANYPETGNIETLVALMKCSGSHLDRQTITSIVQFRECAEGMAVRLLAEHHTSDMILSLRLQIHDMKTLMHRSPPPGIAEFAQMIFKFHLKISLYSGNNVLPMVLNGFHDVSITFWQEWIKYTGVEGALDFLERFTAKIGEGDGAGAMQLCRENADDFLEKYLGEQPS